MRTFTSPIMLSSSSALLPELLFLITCTVHNIYVILFHFILLTWLSTTLLVRVTPNTCLFNVYIMQDKNILSAQDICFVTLYLEFKIYNLFPTEVPKTRHVHTLY